MEDIISALVTLKGSGLEPLQQEPEVNDGHTCESVTESIVRNLHTNNTEFAIKTLHAFRKILNLNVGMTEEDDIELIISLYARYLVEKKAGTLAMIQSSKSEFTFASVSSELKERTIHLLSVIEQLNPGDKT